MVQPDTARHNRMLDPLGSAAEWTLRCALPEFMVPGPISRHPCLDGCHDLCQQDAHCDPRGTGSQCNEPNDAERPCPSLDHQVHGQRPIIAVGLQEPAIDGEKDPHRSGSHDGHDANGIGLVEQRSHPLAGDDHHHEERCGHQGALSMESPSPVTHPIGIASRSPHRHAADDGHDDR